MLGPSPSLRTSHVAVIAILSIGGVSAAQVTERVDLGPGGVEGSGGGDLTAYGACVSADGRFIVFQSGSPNLVSGDTNGTWDVFVRDRVADTTERVSVDSAGGQANGESGTYGIAMSPDGRFVAFQSYASNLVASDVNGVPDIFVHDRLTGVTELVSVDSFGVQANDRSSHPSISADGRFVAFDSDASNLVTGDTNALTDVFVRDRTNGTTIRVSLGVGAIQATGASYLDAISADGQFVAYTSLATNLVPGDTNGFADAFVVDLQSLMSERVSVSSGALEGDGPSGNSSISSDGRFVAFLSNATNLVPNDTNGAWDIFVRDRMLGTTERASVGTGGTQGTYCEACSISSNGRYVAFTTGSDFFPGDTAWRDIYIHDRMNDTTDLASLTNSGGLGNWDSDAPSISPDGRFVVFESAASNLVAGDTNALVDVFIRDRFATGFASACDPGLNNVIVCPCGNQPSGRARGCDNSSATGGASLSASGIAYLSTDGLVFTTSDEKPTATSVLLQGDASIATGIVFGQGVRCAGGSLKRMYVKIAVNGSIAAPDLTAGDPTISARSAQLGVTIQPGQPYYYLVYYRDPIVLGGCSAGSTFNATQTGSVTYWP
jgi:Tol biopolymer transport system component